MKKFPVLCMILALTLTVMGCGGNAFAISFSETELSEVYQVKLYNGHNGEFSFITNQQAVSDICDFIRTISGEASAKQDGFYEGSYTVTLMDAENAEVLELIFGDCDVFYCLVDGAGENMRFDMAPVTAKDVISFFSQYDTSGFDWN